MSREPATRRRKLPAQKRSKITVELLLEATTRVLKKHGYAKADTNRIAEVAGVSIGTLYQYFSGKESLIAAVVERHVDELTDLAKVELANAAKLPIRRSIEQVVQFLVKAHSVDPELHRILDEQVPKLGRADHRRKNLEMLMAILANRYRYRQRRGELLVDDPELAAFMIVHLSEAIVHEAVYHRPELLANGRLVAGLTDLIARYLRVT
jgi:AcrR family transcriptional regulator